MAWRRTLPAALHPLHCKVADNDLKLCDPKHWELCAEEARVIATTLDDPEAKAMMATVVETYEQMARRATVLQQLLHPLPRDWAL